MSFVNIELDICPGYGWQGGPEFNTRVTTLRNAHERRNATASIARHRFILPFLNISKTDYVAEVLAVFNAVRGRLHSFKVKDWTDYTATNEPLGDAPTGTTAVQLVKTYTAGAESYVRDITKPVAGAVIYENGSPKAGTLDVLTGLFTPTNPWASEATLTWTGEFRVPVRFNTDTLMTSIDNVRGDGYALNLSLELVEVFGE